MDVYGHVNNVKYFEYFQEARIRCIARLWEGLEHAIAPGGRADRRRLPGADPVPRRAVRRLVVGLRVGSRSATIESVICDGDTVLSRARVTIVFFDQETQRSTRRRPSPTCERLPRPLPS